MVAANDEVLEDLNFSSDRISNQVRTLSLGVLALVWLFLSGNTDVAGLDMLSYRYQLVCIGILVIIVMLLDLGQYVVSYYYSSILNRTGESYDPKHLLYKSRYYLFWGKLIFVVSGSLWIVILLVLRIFETWK